MRLSAIPVSGTRLSMTSSSGTAWRRTRGSGRWGGTSARCSACSAALRPKRPGRTGYSSSVQVRKLWELENLVRSLWSPLWPDGLPAIDEKLRQEGEEVSKRVDAARCHQDIVRTDAKRTVKAKMIAVGTDDRMAVNFAKRRTSTGKLEGAYKQVVGPPIASGDRLGPEASAEEVLSHAVIGTIVGSGYPAPQDELTKIEFRRRRANVAGQFAPSTAPGGIYKGRPLNGIWATAPYLHNGSVPTLADLLKPAKDRRKTFSIGSRSLTPRMSGSAPMWRATRSSARATTMAPRSRATRMQATKARVSGPTSLTKKNGAPRVSKVALSAGPASLLRTGDAGQDRPGSRSIRSSNPAARGASR